MLFHRIFILILFLVFPEFALSNEKSLNNSEFNSSSALLDSLLDYKVSQPDKAIKFAIKVLQRDKYATGLYPKVESSFYNHLGEIYIRMNLPSQALSYFIEAKRMGPDKKNTMARCSIWKCILPAKRMDKIQRGIRKSIGNIHFL